LSSFNALQVTEGKRLGVVPVFITPHPLLCCTCRLLYTRLNEICISCDIVNWETFSLIPLILCMRYTGLEVKEEVCVKEQDCKWVGKQEEVISLRNVPVAPTVQVLLQCRLLSVKCLVFGGTGFQNLFKLII
jgi:hypothetical protein